MLQVNQKTNSSSFTIEPYYLPNELLELSGKAVPHNLSLFNNPAYSHFKTTEQKFAAYCRDNTYWAATWLLNINLFPFQSAILTELFNKRFAILLMSRGSGKSYAMAAYALLRAILYPGEQIVVISFTFRQVKEGIFRYMENMINGSPILREYTEGVKHHTDGYTIQIGQSRIIGLPLGETTRGVRSTCTLIDERGLLPKDVIDVVIRGFSVVNIDPMAKSIQDAAINKLIAEGMDKKELSLLFKERFNQIIMAGTATYQFNSYYDDYKNYMNIIKYGHNKRKLSKILGTSFDSDELRYIDPEDFMVVKVPYYRLPDGFLDMKIVSANKIDMDSSQFAAEYECVTGDFYSLTIDGFKQIIVMKEGENAITHDGCVRNVKRKFMKEFSGVLAFISFGEDYNSEMFTLNHPVWTTRGQIKAGKLKTGDYVISKICDIVKEVDELDGVPINPETLYLIGCYLISGFCGTDDRVYFRNIPYHVSNMVKKFILNNFTVDRSKIRIRKRNNSTNRNVRIESESLYDFLFSRFGRTIYTRKIDRNIMWLHQDIIYHLISGILECVKNNKRLQPDKHRLVIENIELGLGISYLFARCGIVTKVKRKQGYAREQVGVECYSSPRCTIKFTTSSDSSYIKDGVMYRKVKFTDTRKTKCKVYNLEVDGPEHSFCGPYIAVGNCHFPADSDGFYKRSLISSCERENVEAMLQGDPNKKYIAALDTARAKDRAAIVILEVSEQVDIRKCVYCWSTREDEISNEIIPEQSEKESDGEKLGKKRYYKLLANKLRDLHKRFNLVRIIIDVGSGGGGVAVKDELQDLESSELPYWEVGEPSQVRNRGHHVLVCLDWNNKWISTSNHRMRANMEQNKLLFPKLTMDVAKTLVKNWNTEVGGDELERIYEEIEQLKTELVSIVVTSTSSGINEKFGLPKQILGSSIDGNSRWKDRYSALLMCDDAANLFMPTLKNIKERRLYGGIISELSKLSGQSLYNGYESISRGGVYKSKGKMGNDVAY